jgi:hypothetical protein
MAAVDLAAIASSLATIFEDKIATSINRSVVLNQVIPVKDGAGKNLSWVARFGTATPAGAVIADGADVSVYNSDTKVPATLQYGTYHDAFSITGKARAAAAVTGNPTELEDLYGEEIEESVTRLAMAIGVDCYTGDGSSDTIHGLRDSTVAAVGATGTYAGISRVTYSQWQSTVMANGGVARDLTFALMREMRRRIYVASGMKPDLIVCDPVTHENYGQLFGEQRRYVDSVRIRGEKIVLDGGYQVLEFDGVPVIEDNNAPAGEMLFLNSRYISMRPLPHAPDAINQGTGMIPLHGTEEEQFGEGSSGLVARINPLAITGDAYKFQLICYPQLQVRKCNCHGALTDLRV